MAKTTKKSKLKLPKKIVLEINRNTLLAIAIASALLLLVYSFGRANGLSSLIKANPSPIPSIIPSPSPTLIPPPKTQYNAPKPITTAPSPLPSIDPNKKIVKCTINPKCGGGFKEMTRESCQNTVCCKMEPFDSSWELRTKPECSQYQSTNMYQFCIDGCSVMWNKDICKGWADIDLGKKIECENEQSIHKIECINSCDSSN